MEKNIKDIKDIKKYEDSFIEQLNKILAIQYIKKDSKV